MADSIQLSLVLIKPDAFKRGLVFEIMQRFEKKGYEIVEMNFHQAGSVPRKLIEEHYVGIKDLPHFSLNTDFMMSGPLIAVIYKGVNAISGIRRLQGTRDTPGTIRGDYVTEFRQNLIHASDSEEEASREIGLWFGPSNKI